MLLHPELEGHAVAVCGDPEKRHGIILAKNMAAKSVGVKTAEPVWKAMQKCPNLVLVPPTYKKYAEFSSLVYSVYTEFTSEVESFGLDECWLDVTGCQKLFGSGKEIADKVRLRVKEKTGGLTVSVGVSYNKIFAKLGSDIKKPDAVTIIDKDNYKDIAWKLPVSQLLYVGRTTAERLDRFNIKTIGDLARADQDFLVRQFGKAGAKLSEYARGEDSESVKCYTEKHIPDSVGNGTTTAQDITNFGDATSIIFALSEMVGFRLRQSEMLASGVSIYYRDTRFKNTSRQGKLFSPTSSAYDIATKALDLLKANYDFSRMLPLRMVTISAYGLVSGGEYVQTDIFASEGEKKSKLDISVDRLRKKYGYGILRRGVTIETIFSCDSREAEDDFLPFDKTRKGSPPSE